MQTLLLLVGGYLLLADKSPSGQTQAPAAPPPQRTATGTDLGAAFGAFLGGLLNEVKKDNP